MSESTDHWHYMIEAVEATHCKASQMFWKHGLKILYTNLFFSVPVYNKADSDTVYSDIFGSFGIGLLHATSLHKFITMSTFVNQMPNGTNMSTP